MNRFNFEQPLGQDRLLDECVDRSWVGSFNLQSTIIGQRLSADVAENVRTDLRPIPALAADLSISDSCPSTHGRLGSPSAQ